MRKTLKAVAVLAAVCLGGAAPEPSVTIDSFAFAPAECRVTAGTVVVWTNRDDIPPTVTSADTPHLFRSAPLDTGDTFSYRFDYAGRFGYSCSLHAHMQRVVVVQ